MAIATHSTTTSATHSHPVSARRDVAIATAVALSAALLFTITSQGWLWGDGPQLVGQFARTIYGEELLYWIHVLYIPACHSMYSALPVATGVEAMELTSALSAAAALFGAYLFSRCLGASRSGTVFAVALLAITPSFWFHATTIEVHSLNAAMVSLVAVVTAWMPWRHRALALTCLALAFPLVYLSHRSGLLLGPGWVLLVGVASRRQSQAISLGRLAFFVGPTLLAAMVLAMAAANFAYKGSFGLGVGATLSFFQGRPVPPLSSLIYEGVLWPLAVLIPVVLVGIVRSGSWERIFQLGVLLPMLGCHLFFFDDPNEGGYFLALTPFLVLLAARCWDTSGHLWRWLLLLALVLQGGLGITKVTRSGFEHLVPARHERAAALNEILPTGGVYLSFDPTFQTISGLYEDLFELPFWHDVIGSVAKGESAEAYAATRVAWLRHEIGTRKRPVVIGLGYRAFGESGAGPLQHIESFVAAVREQFDDETIQRPGGDFLLLRN